MLELVLLSNISFLFGKKKKKNKKHFESVVGGSKVEEKSIL